VFYDDQCRLITDSDTARDCVVHPCSKLQSLATLLTIRKLSLHAELDLGSGAKGCSAGFRGVLSMRSTAAAIDGPGEVHN
jgi:hypothetical protein